MQSLLTRKDAAQRLGISEVTVDRLRKAGKLAYIQHIPNGKVWFTEDALEEYLARATHPAKPPVTVRDTYRKRRVKNAI